MPGPLVFTLIFIAIVAIVWFFSRSPQRGLEPSNDLERLLLDSVHSTHISDEMRQQLASAVLLGLEAPDAPDVPMDFSAIFPAEFARGTKEYDIMPDGRVRLGPWVVCFSSRQIVNGLAADPVMGGMVTQLGKVREYPARQIFQSALDSHLDVVLNPFFGVSRRFTQDDLQSILGAKS